MTSADVRPDPAAQIGALIFAVLLIDPRGTIAEANQAAENLLGKSIKHLVGLALDRALPVDDVRVREMLANGATSLVARDVPLGSESAVKRVNLTASPLPNHANWRVVTISEAGRDDITRGGGDDAVTLGAPTILAHEIKNPLSAIRGAAQLAGRKLEAKDRALATMITDEVDRIARLIDRMQQLGSTTVTPAEPCNPHEAIRSAIATVRAGAPEGVEIKEEFDPSLPPVLASRDALEQVMINLISNACDAAALAEEGRACVMVRTRFVSGLVFSATGPDRAVKLPVEISVSDNGPGIDSSLRDHVFEPFVTSKKSGQGLGLALVRKLVRDMKGNIGHDRSDGDGLTNFRINLPLAPESETA